MSHDQPKNPKALDVPVNLAMLTTNTWTPLNWPIEEIHERQAPPFILKGHPLKTKGIEAHCVIKPSELWIRLFDERGNRWLVTVRCCDGCVQAQVTEEPRGFNYSSPPTR